MPKTIHPIWETSKCQVALGSCGLPCLEHAERACKGLYGGNGKNGQETGHCDRGFWVYRFFRDNFPIMENQMEEKLETYMETWVVWGLTGFVGAIPIHTKKLRKKYLRLSSTPASFHCGSPKQ